MKTHYLIVAWLSTLTLIFPNVAFACGEPRYQWYIGYAFSTDSDTLGKARQLESAAIVERERCKAIVATVSARASGHACEIAFRESIASIPGATFSLSVCGTICETPVYVADISSNNAVNPDLNQTYSELLPGQAAVLGVYSTPTEPCRFMQQSAYKPDQPLCDKIRLVLDTTPALAPNAQVPTLEPATPWCSESADVLYRTAWIFAYGGDRKLYYCFYFTKGALILNNFANQNGDPDTEVSTTIPLVVKKLSIFARRNDEAGYWFTLESDTANIRNAAGPHSMNFSIVNLSAKLQTRAEIGPFLGAEIRDAVYQCLQDFLGQSVRP